MGLQFALLGGGGGGGGAKDSNESMHMSLHVIVSVLKRNEVQSPHTHACMHTLFVFCIILIHKL